MDWIIKDNIFLPNHCTPNKNVKLIANALKNFKINSIYIRGSIIENKPMHPNSDIDLYLIHKETYISRDNVLDIVNSLYFINRFVDMHLIRFNSLDYDIPNRLLLNNRSIHIGGPQIQIKPVELNHEMITQHWKVYNPSFTPDVMLSTLRSRVCALKNLTRCFGLINLIENRFFSRDIDECLNYAKIKDNLIYEMLIKNWSIVDIREPMILRDVKEYLINYQKMFEANYSPKGNKSSGENVY